MSHVKLLWTGTSALCRTYRFSARFLCCVNKGLSNVLDINRPHVYFANSYVTENKGGVLVDEDELKQVNNVTSNLTYFKKLVSDLENTSREKSGLPNKIPVLPDEQARVIQPGISKPQLQSRSSNLATYARESETLTQLVQLGVDLSVVEKYPKVANHLVKANFMSDIQPYIVFLHDIGVPNDDLHKVLTKHPQLLLETMHNIQVRVNYLTSKRFSTDAIARIVTKGPKILTTEIKQIDAQLGFLQMHFKLSGDEVRDIVTRHPKIAVWPTITLQDNSLSMKLFLGFSEAQQKQIITAQPKILLQDKQGLISRFDYLHNVMGLSHDFLIQWPDVFRTRPKLIKERHLFLKHIGRAQYDPKLPNFVSMRALVSGRDGEFCRKVAKVPVQEFNNFLKTL